MEARPCLRTWRDVLVEHLPDGVLQRPHVLGCGEVLVRQVGLVDLPFNPEGDKLSVKDFHKLTNRNFFHWN